MDSEKLILSKNREDYPLIIFNGDMYEVNVFNNDIILNKISYIKYFSSLISEIFPVFIDVVSIEFLPKYLQLVNQELIKKAEEISIREDMPIS